MREWFQRFLPTSPASLRRRGVLGINGRNLDCLYASNPRALYPLVDDKVQTKQLCHQHAIPVPETCFVVRRYGELQDLPARLAPWPEFVVKPAHGAGGRGILVLAADPEGGYHTPGRRHLSEDDLVYHFRSILAGLYSLGGQPDTVLVEQRIVCHPLFAELAVQGTPDIRVLVYRGVPVMAMVRLPTRESHGHANLHQGAIGAGIDLATGHTLAGVHHDHTVELHPDTGVAIRGLQIPDWPRILHAASRLARLLHLDYLGVDLMIDAAHGPLIVEANARPGLAIQIANRAGLVPRLALVDALTNDALAADPEPMLLVRLAACV